MEKRRDGALWSSARETNPRSSNWLLGHRLVFAREQSNMGGGRNRDGKLGEYGMENRRRRRAVPNRSIRGREKERRNSGSRATLL